MKETSVINAPEIIPSVSLIVPTDKSYPQYKVDGKRLKALLKKAEKELLSNFPESRVQIVIKKLHKLIMTIDHKLLSKSLAIYASPEKEEIIYLPFSVKEKLIIDSSFEVRDLLYSAKNSFNYLLLLISSHQPRVYYGYNNTLVEAEINSLPAGIESIERDYPSKVSNFSDSAAIKEMNLDKYLREIDHALTEELKEEHLPVIVCATKRTIGHFKKLTKNSKKIIDYIEGNYNHSSKEEIYKVIEPSLMKKREIDQQKVIDMLEEAANKKECVCGIENVLHAVGEKRGRLLIVEKDYKPAAKLEKDKYTLVPDDFNIRESSVVLQDAVDDIIELVLKNAGDIAFVDNGKLKKYKKIALITYY